MDLQITFHDHDDCCYIGQVLSIAKDGGGGGGGGYKAKLDSSIMISHLLSKFKDF